MRYPILTIHGESDIEITATKEEMGYDFFSGKLVNGIVVYAEQWKKGCDDFAGISILLQGDHVVILKNHLFDEDTRQMLLQKVQALHLEIADYLQECEGEMEHA